MTNDTKGLLAGQNEGRGAYVLAATCDLKRLLSRQTG